MKKIIVIIVVLLLNIVKLSAQNTDIAVTNLKSLDGNSVSSSVFNNDGKPFIIDFWATWCKPCVAELNAIAESYPDWKKETGVKIFIVSIDDARTTASVSPFIAGKNWDYEVYLDVNSDFRRAMNVNNVPHTFLFDGKGKIIAQHNTYSPGDEEKLYEELKGITSK